MKGDIDNLRPDVDQSLKQLVDRFLSGPFKLLFYGDIWRACFPCRQVRQSVRRIANSFVSQFSIKWFESVLEVEYDKRDSKTDY